MTVCLIILMFGPVGLLSSGFFTKDTGVRLVFVLYFIEVTFLQDTSDHNVRVQLQARLFLPRPPSPTPTRLVSFVVI